MKTEKELIGKIRELRQIKPSKDWVVLTKTQILGEEQPVRERVSISIFRALLYKPKLVLATVLSLFILFRLFSFAQNSLPGDFLYSIKKITEKCQAVFVSEVDKPQASLELANKRLEELTKIAETNQVKKLAPAINEFQASISEATKNLSKMEASSSDPVAIKKIVDRTKELGEKIQEVKSLGVVIEEGKLEELQKVSDKLELGLLVSILKDMISDLENRTLTEKQEEILSQMRELVEKEKYSEALELYLTNQ